MFDDSIRYQGSGEQKFPAGYKRWDLRVKPPEAQAARIGLLGALIGKMVTAYTVIAFLASFLWNGAGHYIFAL